MPKADAAVPSARGVRAGAGARDGSHVLIFITTPKIQDRHPLALSYPPPPATAGGGQRRADRVSQARCVPIARDRQAAWPSSSAPPLPLTAGRAAPRGCTACAVRTRARRNRAGQARCVPRTLHPATAGVRQRRAVAPCAPLRARCDHENMNITPCVQLAFEERDRVGLYQQD